MRTYFIHLQRKVTEDHGHIRQPASTRNDIMIENVYRLIEGRQISLTDAVAALGHITDRLFGVSLLKPSIS